MHGLKWVIMGSMHDLGSLDNDTHNIRMTEMVLDKLGTCSCTTSSAEAF